MRQNKQIEEKEAKKCTKNRYSCRDLIVLERC